MNFVRPATKKAAADLEDNAKNFDLETRVRQIVAEMLLSMNDKLQSTDRLVRSNVQDMRNRDLRIEAVDAKVERLQKVWEQIETLKHGLRALEKGMAQDIETAVQNHDEITLEVRSLKDRVKEIGKERAAFMLAQDQLRLQVKDYEKLMGEQRGVLDRQVVDFKGLVTERLDLCAAELKDLAFDRRQMRAMIKNQNYHFTELQKALGVLKSRTTAVEKTCAEVPGLIQYTEATDCYLQNYLPTEMYAEIHTAMYQTLLTAPTKMRLDLMDYSQKRMCDALEKIGRIGSLTQETFVKNEFVPLKLDFDAYAIRTQYEDEERERIEREEREAAAALIRKTSEQIFKDKLFNRETLKKMALAMEKRLTGNMRKLMNRQIDTNPWMLKLIKFYQDEMGSSDSDSDSDGSSSASGASSGRQSSASSRSARSRTEKRPSSSPLSRQPPQQPVVVGRLSEQVSSSSIRSQSAEPSAVNTVNTGDSSSQEQALKSGLQSLAQKAVGSEQIEKSAASGGEGSSADKNLPPEQSVAQSLLASQDSLKSQSKAGEQQEQVSSTPEPASREKKPKRKKSRKQPEILVDDENWKIEEDDDLMEDDEPREPKGKKSKKQKKASKHKRRSTSPGDAIDGLGSQASSKGKEKKVPRAQRKLQEELAATMAKIQDVQQQQQHQKQELEAIGALRAKQAALEQSLESAQDRAAEAAIEKQIQAALERQQKAQGEARKSPQSPATPSAPPKVDVRAASPQGPQEAGTLVELQKRVKKEKEKKRKEKAEKGPRTGAKAHKEALQDVFKRLDNCVGREEFEKSDGAVQRAIASVSVFRAQMKVFQKKFASDRQYDARLEETNGLLHQATKVFAEAHTAADHSGGDAGRMTVSLKEAAEMKKALQGSINRVDLLTDSKITDIKGLMRGLAEQVIKLGKRVTQAESEMFKRDYQSLPPDVMALTKSEFELKQELAVLIESAKETQDGMAKEFKRLRREHYGNLKDVQQILVGFNQLQAKLQVVTDQQGLSDQAMASIFKVMKLDSALDAQDESDRHSLTLMGLTNTGQNESIDQALSGLQATTNLEQQLLDADARAAGDPQSAHATGNQEQQTGKYIKKLRASTTIPIEHKVQDDGQHRGVKVISLDPACQSHAPAAHNEIVMKAFKMACLQYQPSPVLFEQVAYKRPELIAAKDALLKYSLSQLKHLDLGVLSPSTHITAVPPTLDAVWTQMQQNQESEGINHGEIDPSKLPGWDSDRRSQHTSEKRRELRPEWLNQDSIESLRQNSNFQTIQPNSSRRMEPMRLSVPVQAKAGAATQRGRHGMLGDSQLGSNTTAKGATVAANASLDGAAMTHLRQASSLHRVNRPVLSPDPGFDANLQFPSGVTSPTQGFDDQIVGRNYLRNSHEKNGRHTLFTQGAQHKNQTQRQRQFNNLRQNLRTQAGQKKIDSTQPSYDHTQGESTVFSSVHNGGQHTSVYAKNNNNQQIGTNHTSFDSRGGTTDASRGVFSPQALQPRKLPSLPESAVDRPVNVQLPIDAFGYKMREQLQQAQRLQQNASSKTSGKRSQISDLHNSSQVTRLQATIDDHDDMVGADEAFTLDQ